MSNVSTEEYSQAQATTLGAMVHSPDGLKLVTQWSLASDRNVVSQATYDDLTTHMHTRLASIRIPIGPLYLWEPAVGTIERVDSYDIAQYAGAALFKSECIKGSRHVIMLDQPQLFAAA